MRRGNPAAVSYHYKPRKAAETGEIMLYKVSVWMGCGYAEISRRKSLEKAISDAAKAVDEYGAESEPLINGKPWHFVMDFEPIARGLYARRV